MSTFNVVALVSRVDLSLLIHFFIFYQRVKPDQQVFIGVVLPLYAFSFILRFDKRDSHDDRAVGPGLGSDGFLSFKLGLR